MKTLMGPALAKTEAKFYASVSHGHSRASEVVLTREQGIRLLIKMREIRQFSERIRRENRSSGRRPIAGQRLSRDVGGRRQRTRRAADVVGNQQDGRTDNRKWLAANPYRNCHTERPRYRSRFTRIIAKFQRSRTIF